MTENMKGFLLWLLYNPFTQIVSFLKLSTALRLADLLGDLDHLLLHGRDGGFDRFMQRVLSGSPLEVRKDELKRECFRYRYRNFVYRIFQVRKKITIPAADNTNLAYLEGRGLSFPLCHFGYFYLGFTHLGTSLAKPIYNLSIIKDKNNFFEQKCVESKKKMLRAMGIHPVFDINFFKDICMPEVIAGRAAYLPTLDGVSARSKQYPFLGGEVVMLIEPTARFAIKNKIPLVPFFVVGDEPSSLKVLQGPVMDPLQEPAITLRGVEKWYLSLLEERTLAYPEKVDWYFWWKNIQRFEKIPAIPVEKRTGTLNQPTVTD
jgi:hypothetical protein